VTRVAVSIEYGAVEAFSGISSVGVYTLLAPFDPGPNYAAKFLIRVEKRVKDVYMWTGLLKVWNTISTLNKAVGDPPLGTSWADWDFRRDIAGIPGVAAKDGSVSLRSLAHLITVTPPVDTKPSLLGTSMRDLLNV
jgi:hypothetical protein